MVKINVIAKAKIVFVTNNDAVLCKLFTTRLPSSTTAGNLAKLESSKIICEMFLAASAPLAIAIEQSERFKAKISLTPSPVMATVLPASFRAITKTSFCSGVTLPNTVYCKAIFLTSSKDIPSNETYLSALAIPASDAIADTVLALSPEITLISTPLFLNQANVSAASSLMWSLITIKATASSVPEYLLSLMTSEPSPKTTTR